MPSRIAHGAVVLASLLALLAFAACGDDDDDETAGDAAVVTETETETETQDAGGGPYGGAATEQPPKPGGEARRAQTVEMVDFAFAPAKITIQAGGKVTWKNQGQAPHTATANDESFDTGTVEAGKLKGESFKQAGTYRYICTIHPQMKGTVEVVG
jgi:plastocyanin